MLKLMIGNQKGGVGKTTTAITLARCLADRGLRTLLIDADPQGSIGVTLKIKTEHYLSEFILDQLRLQDCIHSVAPNLDILFGNRDTNTMEQRLFTSYAREHVFHRAFRPYDNLFDAVLIDVAPSISLLQACSMIYCENVLIPVSMDTLSVSGAGATIFSAKMLSDSVGIPINVIGLLPTIVNRRFGLTDVVMGMIEALSKSYSIPILPAVRTDQSVGKAGRLRQMLKDAEPNSKALEDYEAVTTELLKAVSLPVRDDDTKQTAAV